MDRSVNPTDESILYIIHNKLEFGITVDFNRNLILTYNRLYNRFYFKRFSKIKHQFCSTFLFLFFDTLFRTKRLTFITKLKKFKSISLLLSPLEFQVI